MNPKDKQEAADSALEKANSLRLLLNLSLSLRDASKGFLPQIAANQSCPQSSAMARNQHDFLHALAKWGTR